MEQPHAESPDLQPFTTNAVKGDPLRLSDDLDRLVHLAVVEAVEYMPEIGKSVRVKCGH